MAAFDMDIRYIKGIGEARAKLFAKLGVLTLGDLISYFPRTYEDRTRLCDISSLPLGEAACAEALVAEEPRTVYVRKGLQYTKLKAVDDSGTLHLTFFNQNYVRDSLKIGGSYVFYGVCESRGGRREMTNPIFESSEKAGRLTGRIMPVYRLTRGLSNSVIARSVELGLKLCADVLPEAIPDEIRQKYGLCHARYAYVNIHRPADFKALELARYRLIFEELFVFAAGLRLLKSRRSVESAPEFGFLELSDFYECLPFELTRAQKRSIDEAAADLSSGRPMNRLLQGDVGSGKTAVAAALIYLCAKSGLQALFMAPTEILAEQHFRTLTGFLEPLGLKIELLTGSLKAAQKRSVKSALALGQADVAVGTHALLSGGVELANPGLMIVDEQHRFGVRQRAALSSKGQSPHVLVMSATPIPRTLALIMYSDLSLSVLDELPPGRKEVRTFLVGEDMRKRIESFIRKLVAQGRQVYIVCPVIEEGEQTKLRSAEQYAKELRTKIFPELKTALIHGKIKPAEKDRLMSAFAKGEYDILVATTVIEVGVDVSNAALMLVENAERFGLSQLHQLRGRVGRGEHQSYCVLFADKPSAETRARLEVMTATADGFKIAEEDLKLRGPGDFFGARQHGLPEFKIANMASDMAVLRQAMEAADGFLQEAGGIRRGGDSWLLARIKALFRDEGDIFN